MREIICYLAVFNKTRKCDIFISDSTKHYKILINVYENYHILIKLLSLYIPRAIETRSR